MANAVTWWSDSSMSVSVSRPRHFASAFLGAPRMLVEPKKEQSQGRDVTIAVSDRSNRLRPTGSASFRRGAEPPAKASLGIFVLIGLVVGLFAFGMMRLCLEDPTSVIAARQAKRAAAAVTSVVTPDAITTTADPVPSIVPNAVITVSTTTTTTEAKPAHVARRRTAVKKTRTTTLPANPYGT